MVIDTWGPEETRAFGKKMGQEARPGQVICLNGDLGVGKTIFTQGFAEGLGIDEPVNSPTFTIVQQYDTGRLPLYHFDVYRIGDISEMDEIGYEDCFYGDGVSLIEWSQLIEEIRSRHIQRLQAGQCTIQLGFVLSDLLTNIERASDHCSNIAVSVIEECSGGPGRHAYLQEVKAGGAFGEDLRRDRKKYHLPEA